MVPKVGALFAPPNMPLSPDGEVFTQITGSQAAFDPLAITRRVDDDLQA